MALPLRTAPCDLLGSCSSKAAQPRIALRYAITNNGCIAAAPVVSASSTNRPLSSGLTLTISGLNYGGANLTPTSMSPTAALCSTTSWTSLTTVACTAQAHGAGGGMAVAQLALMVIVSLQAGTGAPQKFTFDGMCGTTLCRIMADIEYPTVPHSTNHSASVVFALLVQPRPIKHPALRFGVAPGGPAVAGRPPRACRRSRSGADPAGRSVGLPSATPVPYTALTGVP